MAFLQRRSPLTSKAVAVSQSKCSDRHTDLSLLYVQGGGGVVMGRLARLQRSEGAPDAVALPPKGTAGLGTGSPWGAGHC